MTDLIKKYYDKIVAFALGLGVEALADLSGLLRSLADALGK